MEDLGVHVEEGVGTGESIGSGKARLKMEECLQVNAVGLLLVSPKGAVRVVLIKPLTKDPRTVLNIPIGSKFHIQEDLEVK